MYNIVFIIPAGLIRYSVVSALEVIRCSCCLVMNNEFKTNARSKYICKFEVSDRFREGMLPISSCLVQVRKNISLWVSSMVIKVIFNKVN